MRVLLLTPLNESSEYMTMNLMVGFEHSELAADPDFSALSIPSYADYLKSVGLAKNFETSVIMALSTVEDFANTHENCVVIGNCTKRVPFDIILGVNINHEEGVALPDLQVAKLQELYGDDPDLGRFVNNLYTVNDAEYHAGGTVEQIIELAVNLCRAK